MSLRSAWLVVVLIIGSGACGGGGGGSAAPKGAKEPRNAKEKQMQEAKAAGETDGGEAKWGKWRYTGDRNDCFYVLGKRCFKTEKAACQAAACKGDTKCKATGGGPATVSCAK
jgi:hypothetical protein